MIASATAAQAQIIQSGTNTLIFSALLILGILVVALLAAMTISSALTSPLVSLTQTAQEAAQGNFSVRSNVNSRDEIGTLARAFNFMTSELGNLVGRLEQRVTERTSELERSSQTNQQRVQELQIVADVAQAVASLQDLDSLLPQITQIISERFGYYHTGVFMLDDRGEYAVLRAANSEGGRRMLAREHKLRVAPTSIVGTVASSAKPRVSSDVGIDAVYFNNPDLPATHAEMALPLIVGDQLIGVLDVQSTEPSAFGREQIEVLTTLANQVAVAIENARLFGQTSRALTEAQKVYNEFVAQRWEQYSKAQTINGYRFQKGKITSLASPLEIKASATGADSSAGELTFPIRIRNHTIGVLNIRPMDGSRRWSENEMAVARAAVERAALALENARLLDDAQRRSAREHSIGEISARISTASDIDSIMRLAVEELGHKLGSSTEVTLELGSDGQELNHD
jgi:GAF domain-containing protein/HAMP domain-containing protein